MISSGSSHAHQEPSDAVLRSPETVVVTHVSSGDEENTGAPDDITRSSVNPNMGLVLLHENSGLSSCFALFCEGPAPESLPSEEPETAPITDHRLGSHEHSTFWGITSHSLSPRREHSNPIPGTIAPLQVVSALHSMTGSVELCAELERCGCSDLIPELRYVHACYMEPESGSCHEAYLELSAGQLWNVERFVTWEGAGQRQAILRTWLRAAHAREPTHKSGTMSHFAKKRFQAPRRLLGTLCNFFK